MTDKRLDRSRKLSLPSGGDPRDRSSGMVTEDMLGPGLVLKGGRIVPNFSPDSPLFVNERGEIELRAGNGVVVAPGSPMTLQAQAADTSMQVSEKGLRARPSPSQIPGLDARISGVATPIIDEKIAAIPSPAPFAGAGTGDGLVADPGGVPLGAFLGDDGLFHLIAGTTGAAGVTTVNFGAFPGASDASVAVTGQASIVAGSVVQASLLGVATADHSIDEHWAEEIGIMAGNIVAATGFTIYARTGTKRRLWGQWTVAWRWS